MSKLHLIKIFPRPQIRSAIPSAVWSVREVPCLQVYQYIETRGARPHWKASVRMGEARSKAEKEFCVTAAVELERQSFRSRNEALRAIESLAILYL